MTCVTPPSRAVLLRRSVLASLVLLLVTTAATLVGSTAPADAQVQADPHPEWGRTIGIDDFLRKGCRDYPYYYQLTPPEGDWALTTQLVDPKGRNLAADTVVVGAAELNGTGSFRICKSTTRRGVFTIQGTLSVLDGSTYTEGRIPDSTFRLHRAQKKATKHGPR